MLFRSSGGVNFILGKSVAEYELPDNEKTQNVFIKEALLLKQALSLCSSLVDEQTRMEAAFFESVRTMTVRLVSGGTGTVSYTHLDVYKRQTMHYAMVKQQNVKLAHRKYIG